MKTITWASAAVAFGALLTLHACTALRSGADHNQLQVASDDAGERLSETSACTHQQPPHRPSVSDAGGALDLVFATSSVLFGTTSFDDAGLPRYESIGFDLDDTCTGEGQDASCAEPSWANAPHQDGVHGIDNAIAQGLAAMPGVLNSAAASPETAIPMIRVRSYSGGADDDQVQVSLYVGYGVAPRTEDGVGLTDGGGTDLDDGGVGLHWDGNDRWGILPGTLLPLNEGGVTTYSVDQPLFRDDLAYVSGNMLVAHFATAVWPTNLPIAPTDLEPVHQLVMAGKLVPVGDAGDVWELQDLTIGYRLAISDAIVRWARWPLNGDPMFGYICQSKTDYDATKAKLCSYADISAEEDVPTAPCDAFSDGVLIQAKQAKLGDVAPPSPPLPPCAPDVHLESDSCGTSDP